MTQGTSSTARATRESMASKPILIIEDHEDTRQMVLEFLTFEGGPVVTAANGLEGLNACDRARTLASASTSSTASQVPRSTWNRRSASATVSVNAGMSKTCSRSRGFFQLS